MKRLLPKLDWITVHRNQAAYRLPYCFRKGNGGPALLFVHGLGGCKENFYAAFQSAALADCDLLTFDFPGTGLAEFDATTCPDVSTLAELAHLVWKALLPGPVFLVVASMGGLVGLLMMRKYGSAGVEASSTSKEISPRKIACSRGESRPIPSMSCQKISSERFSGNCGRPDIQAIT